MKIILSLVFVFISFAQVKISKGSVAQSSYVVKPGKLLNSNGEASAEFRLNQSVKGSSAREKAFNFLKTKVGRSKSKQSAKTNFIILSEQKTGFSSHFRFQETYESIPIYDSNAKVSLNSKEEVTMYLRNKQGNLKFSNLLSKISSSEAMSQVDQYFNNPKKKKFHEIEQNILNDPVKDSRLIYKVRYTNYEKENHGDFEVLVDAATAELIKVIDLTHYSSDKKNMITGFGYVFDPDPLSAARKNYGDPGFTDNGDADTDSLNAYRKLVSLRGLTKKDSLYYLENNRVQITEIENPVVSIPALSDSSKFLYTRSEQGFEAVNTFYHINESYLYLESLGYTNIKPQAYTGGLKCDAHGYNGSDNSHFHIVADYLAFGEGGVDDAEDPDVVLHEFGHAIQDFIIPDFLGNEGVGEGFGDYWAESYARTVTNWTKSDQQYYWVFNWDGHNQYWNGRISNLNSHYPEGLTSSVHHNGQLWATPLLEIYEVLGRNIMDRLVIQSHYYMNKTANQRVAAEAILQADQDLFSGAHRETILLHLKRYGQLSHISDDVGPQLSRAIDDFTYGNPGGAPVYIILSNHFVDYDSPITYSASSSNESILKAKVSSDTLKLEIMPAGEFTVSVEVKAESKSKSVLDTFRVDIKDLAAPVLTKSISSVSNYLSFKLSYNETLSSNPKIEIKRNNLFIDSIRAKKENLDFVYNFQNNKSGKYKLAIIAKDPGNNTDTSVVDFYFANFNEERYHFVDESIQLNMASMPSASNMYILMPHPKFKLFEKKYRLYSGFSMNDIKVTWNNFPDTVSLQNIFFRAKGNGLLTTFNDRVNPSKSPDNKYSYNGNIVYTVLNDNLDEISIQYESGRLNRTNKFRLLQNYPNPFNAGTTIPFILNESGRVRLDIYNVLGQKIVTLFDKYLTANEHRFTWNGKNKRGEPVSSGIYFYRISGQGQLISKKMIFMK